VLHIISFTKTISPSLRLGFVIVPQLRSSRSLPPVWHALEDAQNKIDAFRWDYNEHRPHRALKGLSPNEYARRASITAADSPS
jgi:transposase InsO family protein